MDQQSPPNPQPAGTPPPQAAPPPSQGGAGSAASSMMASMAPWERFIVIGAIILILGDVVFGVLLREFYAGDLVWLLSAGALLAYYANRTKPGLVPSYATVMLLIAAGIAVVGVRDFVIELYYILRNLSDLSDQALYLVGFIVWIVGVALCAYGAWQQWRTR